MAPRKFAIKVSEKTINSIQCLARCNKNASEKFTFLVYLHAWKIAFLTIQYNNISTLWPLEGAPGTRINCHVIHSWLPFANPNWLNSSSYFVNGHCCRAEVTIKKPSYSSSARCLVGNNALQMLLLGTGRVAHLSFVDVSFIESFERRPLTFALISHILRNAVCA